MSAKRQDIQGPAASTGHGTARWILDRTGTATPGNAPVACIAVPIYRLAEHLKAAVAGAVKPHGLLPAEFEILQSLLLADPDRGLNPSELYQALLMSSGGISKLLKLLDGKGLIAISRDPDDGRQRRIRLTDAGRKRLLPCLSDVMAAEAGLLDRACAGIDRDALTSLLGGMIDRVETGLKA